MHQRGSIETQIVRVNVQKNIRRRTMTCACKIDYKRHKQIINVNKTLSSNFGWNKRRSDDKISTAN